MPEPSHQSVLLQEVLAALALAPGDHAVDATFGAGGYSRAFLEAGATVTAFDRDPRVRAFAHALASAHPGRFTLIEAPFSRMAVELGPESADAVAFDLGVSSMQLDDPAYGMSFRHDAPIDMRMGPNGPSAADLVNGASEAELAEIIFRLGEEPASRRIARALVAARPVATTGQLARVIRAALGNPKGQRRDPATRTFQALRMHVNDELGELARGLVAAERVLRAGGRLAVVSFHSLEDRIVKRFLAERSATRAGGSRHLPEQHPSRPSPSFERPMRPERASAQEIAANPRARSATLRAARRSAAPAWPEGLAA
ncbi:16S rRNA (cytosine(1402)-N(4))-methyltransferase RsmH [Thermaurantiacus sp.]